MFYINSHVNYYRSVACINWHILWSCICKLTKLSLNNIEFFISYFYQLFCFYCYVRMVTLNLTLVLRKKEHTYFSLCQWNVNILVARKKYIYQLHVILRTDMTLLVFQKVFQIRPYLMMTILFTQKDIILSGQIILTT